jgi:hypothetical protein
MEGKKIIDLGILMLAAVEKSQDFFRRVGREVHEISFSFFFHFSFFFDTNTVGKDPYCVKKKLLYGERIYMSYMLQKYS